MGVFLQSCAYFTRHLLYLYLWRVVLLVPKKSYFPRSTKQSCRSARLRSEPCPLEQGTAAPEHLVTWDGHGPSRPRVPLLPAGVSCPASPCGAVLSTSLQFCLKRRMFMAYLVSLQASFLSDTRELRASGVPRNSAPGICGDPMTSMTLEKFR